MNFEFDLESAVNVLDTASDLLLIYTDFYEAECPTEEKLKSVSPMDTLAFTSSYAERSRTYFCLIDNARDKIRTLITQMNEAINAYHITQHNSLFESNSAYNDDRHKAWSTRIGKAARTLDRGGYRCGRIPFTFGKKYQRLDLAYGDVQFQKRKSCFAQRIHRHHDRHGQIIVYADVRIGVI